MSSKTERIHVATTGTMVLICHRAEAAWRAGRSKKDASRRTGIEALVSSTFAGNGGVSLVGILSYVNAILMRWDGTKGNIQVGWERSMGTRWKGGQTCGNGMRPKYPQNTSSPYERMFTSNYRRKSEKTENSLCAEVKSVHFSRVLIRGAPTQQFK